jgi:hypothetical protein
MEPQLNATGGGPSPGNSEEDFGGAARRMVVALLMLTPAAAGTSTARKNNPRMRHRSRRDRGVIQSHVHSAGVVNTLTRCITITIRRDPTGRMGAIR